MQLREYQHEAVAAAFAHFPAAYGTDDHGLVVMPTGSGKSVVIAEIVRQALAANPESRILCLTHVKELVQQNAAKAHALGVPTGIYSAGLRLKQLDQPFTMASVQSVYRADLPHHDLLIVDECHRIPRDGEGMYRRTIENLRAVNPNLIVLGFTATPFRADGSGYLHKGDGALFQSVIYEVGMPELIAAGYLARPACKRTLITYDLDGVATRAGDYAKGELERAIASQEDVTRDALEEATRRAPDRQHWLVFCVSVAHAHYAAAHLATLGIECGVVTGQTPPAERDELVRRFRSGELRALANVFVLTTGFDAPETDCLVILRPTKSPVLWVQMVGRGMRPAPQKTDCLVLDYGENVWRLGTVADPIVRTSSGDGSGIPPMKGCPECEEMMPAGKRECPGCGYIFPPPKSELAASAAPSPVYVDSEPVEFEVTSTAYSRHEKAGKTPSMRVTYTCGLATFISEWVCVEHEGFARRKATTWWALRGGERPCPDTVDEALDRAPYELRTPGLIRVKYEETDKGKFPRVIAADQWTEPAEKPPPETPAYFDLDECPF